MEEILKTIQSLQRQIDELKQSKETREAIERTEAEESRRLFNEYMQERKRYEEEQQKASEYLKTIMK